MNRASIEQALTGLMPTLNGPLPPELMDLALSLLARSRNVAQSLKPDEEIARPYACAQLACERLKKRLNLPTISSRPPCPPRIYKKLYSYLESALPEASKSAPNTPRKTAAQGAASARSTPKTPLSNRKTPRSRAREQQPAQAPPEWTMAVTRALAKAFSQPAVIPHVYTGVESTFPFLAQTATASAPETPSKRPRRTAAAPQPPTADLSDTRVLSLIAVVLFYVLSRMLDQDITPEQYVEWRLKAISIVLESPAGSDSTQDALITEIEDLMRMAQAEGWLGMDWYSNIIPAQDVDDMEGVVMTNGEERASLGKGRSLRDGFANENIGLGTMMQEATDYLGERQRAAYRRWKASMVARIEEIEAS
ncbi:hypothetical protein K491DRAFT_677891 [Lophiostoma macrostomum CBS 122681]|uniref:ORC6 first cyclin-like domain-containing protein n=1 Tax=Lophiostoma macrostomum CBS 122681 TaxID=1314788 RepID=A0A6A6TBA2_9PLEO|nr:hypothetical protein K491DRAFT_677891 [Lophiostoma macrostomum CBS 122681]